MIVLMYEQYLEVSASRSILLSALWGRIFVVDVAGLCKRQILRREFALCLFLIPFGLVVCFSALSSTY